MIAYWLSISLSGFIRQAVTSFQPLSSVCPHGYSLRDSLPTYLCQNMIAYWLSISLYSFIRQAETTFQTLSSLSFSEKAKIYKNLVHLQWCHSQLCWFGWLVVPQKSFGLPFSLNLMIFVDFLVIFRMLFVKAGDIGTAQQQNDEFIVVLVGWDGIGWVPTHYGVTPNLCWGWVGLWQKLNIIQSSQE